MSGPIDYYIYIRAARLARIRAAQEAERQMRAEMTQARLAKARSAAATRIQRAQSARREKAVAWQASERAKIEQMKQALEQQRAEKREAETIAAKQHEVAVAELKHVAASLADQLENDRASEVSRAVASAEAAKPADRMQTLTAARETLERANQENAAQIAAAENAMADLAAARQEIGNHESVTQLRKAQLESWQKAADELLSQYESGMKPGQANRAATELLKKSQSIIDEAESLRARFETRNILLRDVIDSLKAVGFFVSDPSYENPANPESPVIVKASRGGQEMRAIVDLSASVRSQWDGYEGDHCKTAFFEYIAKLGEREIDVDSPVLADRPILKKLGAKDVPSGGKSVGEH